MKVLNKTLVAAGLATAVFASGAAQAATISNASTDTVPTYNKDIVNESVRAIVDVPTVQIQLSAGQDLSIDDSVTFTLSGGTFKAVANDNLGGGTLTAAIADGGVGKSFVKYRVTTAPGVASMMDFAGATGAVPATVDLSGVADSSVVTLTAEMKGFVGGESTFLFGSPLVSNVVRMVPHSTITATSQSSDTFLVSKGFQGLANQSAVTGYSTSGTGSVTVTVNAAATGGQNTASVPNATPTIGKRLIKLMGDMTGVKSISATNVSGSSCTGTATTPAVSGGLTIDSGLQMACGIAAADAIHTTAITFDGSKAYDSSSYTTSVELLTDTAGGFTAGTVGSKTTHVFGRDGSAFVSNSVGKLNKLTVTDRSGALGAGGADGKITMSAWDADGTSVTCTGLDLTVPNNGSLTIQGQTIVDACPGAKRIEGIVNSTKILVTNVKTTADGATMQSSATTGGTAVN